jgi:hypothetical protein
LLHSANTSKPQPSSVQTVGPCCLIGGYSCNVSTSLKFAVSLEQRRQSQRLDAVFTFRTASTLEAKQRVPRIRSITSTTVVAIRYPLPAHLC